MATVLTLGASAQAQRHAPTPAANRSGSPAADVQATAPGQPAKPGAAALARARAAWDKGDFDVAEPLYREAIESGGLDPAEVLDAYVRLGSVCSVLGKKTAALAAFKVAAQINPHFVLPPEAGKRAKLVADRARQASARAGAMSLGATIPSEVISGEAAQVDATLDPAHVAVASAIALRANDPQSGGSYADSQDPAAAIHFKLPASLMLPSAMLSVRVDALDAHQNRLATVEGRTNVRAAAQPAEAPIALTPVLPLDTPGKSTTDEGKDHKSGGGFWSTAWPYVIGGVALAAGGAAIFLATRSSDDVDVGAVHVLNR